MLADVHGRQPVDYLGVLIILRHAWRDLTSEVQPTTSNLLLTGGPDCQRAHGEEASQSHTPTEYTYTRHEVVTLDLLFALGDKFDEKNQERQRGQRPDRFFFWSLQNTTSTLSSHKKIRLRREKSRYRIPVVRRDIARCKTARRNGCEYGNTTAQGTTQEARVSAPAAAPEAVGTAARARKHQPHNLTLILRRNTGRRCPSTSTCNRP